MTIKLRNVKFEIRNGFTMIEVLVVSSIIVLLSGTALTAYITFRDRKQAVSDVRLVVDHLRKVRIKATAVEVPIVSGAMVPGITDYTVVFGATSVRTNVNFAVAAAVNNYIPQITFTSGTVFNPVPSNLVFEARSGSLVGGAVNIVMCGVGKYRYVVAVNEAGVVSDPVYTPAAGCP